MKLGINNLKYEWELRKWKHSLFQAAWWGNNRRRQRQLEEKSAAWLGEANVSMSSGLGGSTCDNIFVQELSPQVVLYVTIMTALCKMNVTTVN